MNEVESTRHFIDISKNLGEINSNIKILCDTIARHEQRICNLEQGNVGNNNGDFKMEMLRLLGKCLIVGMTVIASLTGASSLLQGIMSSTISNVQQQQQSIKK